MDQQLPGPRNRATDLKTCLGEAMTILEDWDYTIPKHRPMETRSLMEGTAANLLANTDCTWVHLERFFELSDHFPRMSIPAIEWDGPHLHAHWRGRTHYEVSQRGERYDDLRTQQIGVADVTVQVQIRAEQPSLSKLNDIPFVDLTVYLEFGSGETIDNPNTWCGEEQMDFTHECITASRASEILTEGPIQAATAHAEYEWVVETLVIMSDMYPGEADGLRGIE